MMRRRDEPGIRSVFRLVAPAFEEREAEADEDPSTWGASLLTAAFGQESRFVEVTSYGRAVDVVVAGIALEVSIGFRDPDWLGFVNTHRGLPNEGAVREALARLDQRLRAIEGVTDVGWSDLSSFNSTDEVWHARPTAEAD